MKENVKAKTAAILLLKKKPGGLSYKALIFKLTAKKLKTKNITFFFINKLFSAMFKSGNKSTSVKYFEYVFNIIKKRQFLESPKKSNGVCLRAFTFILKNVAPDILKTSVRFRRVITTRNRFVKNLKIKNLKSVCQAVIWIKNAIRARDEETLFLKLMSEMDDLINKKSEVFAFKKEHNLDILNNAYKLRFVKKKYQWA